MGMTVPVEYGGGGSDEVSHVLALMEISRASAGVGGFVAWNNSLFCFPLLKYGTEEQKRKYLPPCAAGGKSGSFALIGVNRLTVIEAGGEGWVSGRGGFLPCGVSYGILPAVLQESGEQAFFVIDLERTEGLRREEALQQGGIFLFGVAEAIFDNTPMRAGDLFGRGDAGEGRLQTLLQEAWTAVGALATGIGEGALEEAVNSAGTEHRRGSISQCVEWKLADMAVDLEAARLLVLKAAWMKDRGKAYEKEAAQAKVYAAGAGLRASCEGLAILGGKDPGRRPALEKRRREAEMCRDYYGTIEEAGFRVAEHVVGRASMTVF